MKKSNVESGLVVPCPHGINVLVDEKELRMKHRKIKSFATSILLRGCALIGVALIAGWLVPAPARAASISIDDLTDNVVITWSGFTTSFTINGLTYDPSNPSQPLDPAGGSIQLTEGIDPTTGFPKLFAFSGFFNSPGANNFLHNNDNVIFFSEAGGGISDVLQVGFDARTEVTLMSGVFSSDVDGAPLWTPEYLAATFQPPNATIAEGTNIEVIGLFKPTLPPGFTSVTVSSDVVVPEPASLALLGFGLAGIAASRSRHRA
jgi:hypothetical protein